MKTKVTFSFAKLNKKLDSILPQTTKRSQRDIANQWKENIDNKSAGGKPFKDLAPATVKRRKYKGYNTFYPRTKPENTSHPLKATGNLQKSIRVTDKGISFNKYGDWHVKGSIRPKRNWMRLKTGKQGSMIVSDKNMKKLKQDIRKGFRLAGRGKNIRNMKF
mgnify:FL=1